MIECVYKQGASFYTQHKQTKYIENVKRYIQENTIMNRYR
jgi:hypothetical protein